MNNPAFLVQKYAKLQVGALHVLGYSVAGEETVLQVPQLGIGFDIGRAPWFSLTSDILCISHAHMDHVAGLAYYLSQRQFLGMKPATILMHRDLVRPFDRLLACWRDLERHSTSYRLVGLSSGDTHRVRRDLVIRAFDNHHDCPSLAFSVVNVRHKLKPEFGAFSSRELGALRKKGVEFEYTLEMPLVTHVGDTSDGPVFDHAEIRDADVLLTECTFFDDADRRRATLGKHLHVADFIPLLTRLKNKHVVVTHISRRTPLREAKRMLRQQACQEDMARIHLLMDFAFGHAAGDVHELVPPPASAD